jgi:hypothetical protein
MEDSEWVLSQMGLYPIMGESIEIPHVLLVHKSFDFIYEYMAKLARTYTGAFDPKKLLRISPVEIHYDPGKKYGIMMLVRVSTADERKKPPPPELAPLKEHLTP